MRLPFSDCCPASRPHSSTMSISRVALGTVASVEDGLGLIGVDVGEANAAHRHLMEKEPSWRDGTRVARSGRITPGNLPLVFNNLLKHCTSDIDTNIALMVDNLQRNVDWGIQIYEIFFTEKDLLEKREKNNMVAAAQLLKRSNSLLKRSNSTKSASSVSVNDVNVDSQLLQYNLVIFFQYRSGNSNTESLIDLVHVEYSAQIEPRSPISSSLFRNQQLVRWRALTALQQDGVPRAPRQVTARCERLLLSREVGGKPVIIKIGSAESTGFKLEGDPGVSRDTLGVVGITELIADLAKDGMETENEIETLLMDGVVRESNWQVQIYQIFTQVEEGRMNYRLVVFVRGGYYFQVTVTVQLPGDVLFPSPEHMDMLKCTTIRKFNETFKDVVIRLEFFDGRSASRVGLPGIAPPKSVLKTKQEPQASSWRSFFSKKEPASMYATEEEPVLNNSAKVKPSLDLGGVKTSNPARLRNMIQRQQTLVEGESADPGENATKDKNLEDRRNSPSFAQFPDKLTPQKYLKKKQEQKKSKEILNKKLSSGSFRKLSTCLESTETTTDAHPATMEEHHTTNPSVPAWRSFFSKKDTSTAEEPSNTDAIQEHRPQLNRSTSLLSTTSNRFKDAISDQGRKLSLLVSETQNKPLEELCRDFWRRMSIKKRVLVCLFILAITFFCYFLVAKFGHQMTVFKDGLTGSLNKLSSLQNSQLSTLATRLDSLENIVTSLDKADIAGQLNMVVAKLDTGAEGNSLKVAVMDRLVKELAGIEEAIAGLQHQVREGLRCGFSPANFFSSGNKEN